MSVEKKTTYNRDEIILSGKGELWGEGYAKLPLPNMLMIDRITDVAKVGGEFNKGYIEAELDITPELWFFECHFQDDPVMPGCLGLDAMWQLIGFYLGWLGSKGKGRALGVKELKFTGQILPTAKKVKYKIQIKRVIQGKLVMGLANGTVEVDGEEIYKAEDLKVGLFNS